MDGFFDPDLDVSDVLDDSFFRSGFSIIRSTSSVNGNGINVVTSSPMEFVVGTIQPAGAKDLDRLPDLARQGGSIQIWTRFAMNIDKAAVFAPDGVTVTAPGVAADKIVWKGSTYTVMTCDPWVYGSGYWFSLASLASLS